MKPSNKAPIWERFPFFMLLLGLVKVKIQHIPNKEPFQSWNPSVYHWTEPNDLNPSVETHQPRTQRKPRGPALYFSMDFCDCKTEKTSEGWSKEVKRVGKPAKSQTKTQVKSWSPIKIIFLLDHILFHDMFVLLLCKIWTHLDSHAACWQVVGVHVCLQLCKVWLQRVPWHHTDID